MCRASLRNYFEVIRENTSKHKVAFCCLLFQLYIFIIEIKYTCYCLSLCVLGINCMIQRLFPSIYCFVFHAQHSMQFFFKVCFSFKGVNTQYKYIASNLYCVYITFIDNSHNMSDLFYFSSTSLYQNNFGKSVWSPLFQRLHYSIIHSEPDTYRVCITQYMLLCG